MNSQWNTCFSEARDAHLTTLKANNWGDPGTEQPKTVELGQTTEEVQKVLGAPQKILNAGTKVIYIYADLKVTFQDGKVVDFQ